jgi:hypothetical protein
MQTPVIGGGVAALGNPPNPYQGGMMYMPETSVALNGLGGYANGTMVAQGLINLKDVVGYSAQSDFPAEASLGVF